jgi:hypothetical protein
MLMEVICGLINIIFPQHLLRKTETNIEDPQKDGIPIEIRTVLFQNISWML